MQEYVIKQLAQLARLLIAKHQPKVIGITGSVGKTSSRDAIYAVVTTAFSARRPVKNLNNEIGLPLAILGFDSPGKNFFGWVKIFLFGYINLWFGKFPEVLVLEMGVDRPGDMDYLLSIVKPDISVLTSIGMAHYEFFGSYEAVAQEKAKLLEQVKPGGVCVVNLDNQLAAEQIKKALGKVVTYGFNNQADVRLRVDGEDYQVPPTTKLSVMTSTQEFQVNLKALGVPHCASAGAAIAVGLVLGLRQDQIRQGLANYKPHSGRLNLLNGIKRTLILEDSYNASPDSVKEALAVLSRVPRTQKIIILGDMLELGELSDASHMEIGQEVGQLAPEKLILVGSRTKLIAKGAVLAGLAENKVLWFADSEAAVEHIRENLSSESVVLIKGSQGVRMEKISKELLAEPMSASSVLPRQYGKWVE